MPYLNDSLPLRAPWVDVIEMKDTYSLHMIVDFDKS